MVINVIVTSGSGDACFGGFLYNIRDKSLDEIKNIKHDELLMHLKFACACGTLTATKAGAIPALPTLVDVNEFL